MKLRSFFLQTATVLSFLAASTGVSSAVGNPALGEKVFKKCKACHKIGEGAENSTGPVLTGVVGRKAGTYPGYSYGKSMRTVAKTGMAWDEEKLDGWLTNPKKYLRKILDTRKAKAKMKFKLKKQEDRDNVIAYLKTFSAEKAVLKPAEKTETMAAKDVAPATKIAASEICVENRSGKKLLFVVEAKGGGERILKTLETQQMLCATEKMANGGGTVGVFQDEDALEGCSRLATSGKSERLVAYEPFDNCTWALE
jgi:cytochrome c2